MAVKSLVKRNAARSGLFPDGFHRAVLTEVENHDTKNNSSIRLTFVNGSYEHKEDLWESEKAEARKTLITKRLGLLGDGDDDEVEVDYEKAIGNEYVIEVKREKDQNDQIISKLTYGGVWPLDHDDRKVAAFLRTEAGQVGAMVKAGDLNGSADGHGDKGTNLDDI